MKKCATDCAALYVADFTLWVKGFHQIFHPDCCIESTRLRKGAVTDYELEMANEHNGWVYAKKWSGHKRLKGRTVDVIRVHLPGAILRFNVLDIRLQDKKERQGERYERYFPIGVSFTRVDDIESDRAVPLSSGPTSPFSAVKIEQSLLQFTAVPLHGLLGMEDGELKSVPYITYNFCVFIQRASDGAIGVIDPYEENENPP